MPEASTTRFEGPEKKLEVLLSPSPDGMRAGEPKRWDRIARASGAEILSRISNGRLDAYLLSESSLFVWDDRILMITCGQTSLVDALPVVVDEVGRERVALVFYERRNLMFPEDQPADFEDEAARLVDLFPGKSYRFGPANGDHLHLFHSTHGSGPCRPDRTFQMLMGDLDPDILDAFSSLDPSAGDPAGLEEIYPRMTVDSHCFTPHGFSRNGIEGGSYFTVHVTPQAEGSYVSFETNVRQADYRDVARRLLDIFRPGRFISVLIRAPLPGSGSPPEPAGPWDGYLPAERGAADLSCGYRISYTSWTCLEEADPQRGNRLE